MQHAARPQATFLAAQIAPTPSNPLVSPPTKPRMGENPMTEACIVGWAHSQFGKLEEPDVEP